jgi:hypothetical protein
MATPENSAKKKYMKLKPGFFDAFSVSNRVSDSLSHHGLDIADGKYADNTPTRMAQKTRISQSHSSMKESPSRRQVFIYVPT